MFGPQLLLVLALAAFTAAVARSLPGRRRRPVPTSPGLVDPEAVRGLALIGAGTLGLLALAVLVVGVLGRPDQAEGLAVIGLFAFMAYLPLTVLVSGWLSRR